MEPINKESSELIRKALARLETTKHNSFSPKLSSLLRFVPSLFSSTAHSLDPALRSENLHPVQGSEPGMWEDQTGNAQFIICGPFAIGWKRLKLKMRRNCPVDAYFYLDYGNGFNNSDCITVHSSDGNLDLDRYIYFKEPVKLIRFDPIKQPGNFQLLELSIQSISRPRMLMRSLSNKLVDISARRRLVPAIKHGAKLLLHGNTREFKQKFVEAISKRGTGIIIGADVSAQRRYDTWRHRRQLTNEKRSEIRDEIKAFDNPPLLSILMPVYNVPENYLQLAIESVRSQLYPHWELCLADDCSTAPHIRPYLEQISRLDQRIKVVFRTANGNISAATNSALELATGEYVVLMDNDDEIAEHALYLVAKEIINNRFIDMIYSDEDKIDLQGNHVEPFFKPDWSPEYMLSCMYTCHLGVYRASLVRQVGGFRSEYDTAQDYDLVLRITRQTKNIKHIADVLYHWRMLPSSTATGSSAKPQAHEAGRRALENLLSTQNIQGKVEQGVVAGLHRVRFSILDQPRISIIIPSTCRRMRGEKVAIVERCINSILEKSSYGNYEIIVIDRMQMPADMFETFTKLGVKRITYDEAFNWSRVNNLGARHSDAEHLLFLNDDTEILTADWLESMLEYSQRPEVGAVGAKLLFPNGKVQHAGVTVLKGLPGHAFYEFDGNQDGYFFSLTTARNYIAVTGACLMTRKDVFHSVGGFDEFYPLNYNDVDYCLKVYHSGRRIVYTPYARLLHHESVTRTRKLETLETNEFKRRWYERLSHDPYYNPNLTQDANDFSVGD